MVVLMFLILSTAVGLAMWKILLPLCVIVFNYSVGKLLWSKRHGLKNVGKWAIVTGATDGIGKAFAHELAKDGLNVMLISRNSEKLKMVAAEIRSAYNVQTEVFTCNFFENDFYGRLEEDILKLPSIACLVNNVGVAYPYKDYYVDSEFIDFDFIKKMISCNMTSMACLTRIVLPILLKQECSGGAIINLGSYAGMNNLPLLTLYGATKAFVCHFTKSLNLEIPNGHVILQSVHPLLVATVMAHAKGNPSTLSPKTLASSTLDMLGVETTTYGTFRHAMDSFRYSFVPQCLLLPILRKERKKFLENNPINGKKLQ